MNWQNNISTFDEQLKRIQFITGTSTQLELADFFGIRQSSVSDAKRRGKIPSDWLLALFCLRKVNPEWIFTGNGPHFLSVQAEDYAAAERAEDKTETAGALRLLSSRALAEELLRRITLAEADKSSCAGW